MSKKQYKALNFDLSVNQLKQHYSKDFHNAYYEVRKFLEKNGFEHRQGSGYRSTEKMMDIEIIDIVTNLKSTFPWLSDCVKEFDVTNIGETYSMASLIQNKSMQIKPMSKDKKPSILSALAQAKEKADALNANRPIKPKSKSKEIQR